MPQITEYFQKALSFLIDREPKGFQAKLADSIEISRSYLNDIKQGRTPGPEDLREKIAQYFGLTYEEFLSLGRWIFEGKDPKEWEKKFRRGESVENIAPGPDIIERHVPVISWVQAGAWQEICEEFSPKDAEEYVCAATRVGPNAFALRVYGDSMESTFKEGDIIIVDPAHRPVSGSFIVACLDDNHETTFKQLRFDADRVLLVPLNPRYPIMDMTDKKFRIIGVVRAKIKLF